MNKQTNKQYLTLTTGVPTVGGLEFSMTQKQLQKLPVGGQVPAWGQKFNPWTDDFFPIL